MDATKLDRLRNGALVSKKTRALNFEYFADDVLELIEENANLREELEAVKKDRDEWKESCIDANSRFEKAEARVREAEKQEPVAYGDRLGSHFQSVVCIPSSGVPPWMAKLTPLYARPITTQPNPKPTNAQEQLGKCQPFADRKC